jgi:signal transduction histidine kinase
MIVLLGLFMFILTRTKLKLSITATIISTGMSYAFLTISAILSVCLLQLTADKTDNFLFISVSTFIIEGILVNIPFRFNRLKKGFTFLNNKGAGSLGIFISTILLCCAILLSQPTDDNLVKPAAVIGIVVCTIGIFFFWRRGITLSYLEYLKMQELEEMRTQIACGKEQIDKLIKHNDYLAKIIHKDNKLIPAMELAVRDFLSSSEPGSEQAANGAAILEQLSDATAERSGLISDYKTDNKKLPSTKVFEIDNMLRYMLRRAASEHITFDLVLFGDIKHMTTNIIGQSELQTLLADLIENAIIAVKSCSYKNIRVSIGLTDKCFAITIEDSGVEFQIDTLCKLGIEKVTTHAEDGGSGIGLFTAFDIIKQQNASLIITEYRKDRRSYSKKITILFDSKNVYIVNTHRANKIKKAARRSDMMVNKSK